MNERNAQQRKARPLNLRGRSCGHVVTSRQTTAHASSATPPRLPTSKRPIPCPITPQSKHGSYLGRYRSTRGAGSTWVGREKARRSAWARAAGSALESESGRRRRYSGRVVPHNQGGTHDAVPARSTASGPPVADRAVHHDCLSTQGGWSIDCGLLIPLDCGARTRQRWSRRASRRTQKMLSLFLLVSAGRRGTAVASRTKHAQVVASASLVVHTLSINSRLPPTNAFDREGKRCRPSRAGGSCRPACCCWR